MIVVQRMFLLVYLSVGRGSGKMLYFGAEKKGKKLKSQGNHAKFCLDQSVAT